MTSLGTFILFVLTALTGFVGGCDSNPTPHPGQATADYDAAGPNVAGGEVTGSELPPDRGERDDDLDPVAEPGQGNGFESCPPDADAIAGDACCQGQSADASDAQADAAAATGEVDCGPGETTGAGDSDDSEAEPPGPPTVRRKYRIP